MFERQSSQLRTDEGDDVGLWHEGALLVLLRRLVAPRAAVVLVMEPDGRLVSARSGRFRERSLRSLK